MNYNEKIETVLQKSILLDCEIKNSRPTFDMFDCFEYIKKQNYPHINVESEIYKLYINDSVSMFINFWNEDNELSVICYLVDNKTEKTFMKLQNINTLRELLTISKQFCFTMFNNLITK